LLNVVYDGGKRTQYNSNHFAQVDAMVFHTNGGIKMKKLMGSLLGILTMIWMVMPFAWATPSGGSVTTSPIEVSAEIAAVLELTVKVHAGASIDDPVVTKIGFSTLVLDDNEEFYSSANVFTIEANARTAGRKYSITQTGNALLSCTQQLPNGAYIVTPNALGIAPKSGASYGLQKTAVSSGLLVYSSNDKGQRETINARYTLSSDAGLGSYEQISGDQQAGIYTATLTYTLTLI
jgi:hypothetical protein